MKNKIKYIGLVLMTFFLAIQPVFAVPDEGEPLNYIKCGDSAIPAPIPGITKLVVLLLKVVLPLVLIIMGLLDFTKATMSNNEDGIKKAQNLFIKRIISAAIFFMVITLVQFAVDIVAGITEDEGVSKCANCLISGKDCGGQTTIPFGN